MTSDPITVVSVNISEEKGTVKHPVPRVDIDANGIVGDAHAGMSNRQVSLLDAASIKRFSKEIGREIKHGEFAENITTRGLDTSGVWFLDRIRIGDIELEVTQLGKKCHGDFCAIFREVGRCVMPKEGIFCRVIHPGGTQAGDIVEFIPKIRRCRIITLSDRASSGEYTDRSGPRIEELLTAYLKDRRWQLAVERTVIPDDADTLRRELHAARDSGADIVFTTGGTGIGPRDITTEVVTGECSKLIPGIMEHIRAKYGTDNPGALLSRGVAGVLGEGLIFALPGSVKAVEEYMGEILKTLEHLLVMLSGLDTHYHPGVSAIKTKPE